MSIHCYSADIFPRIISYPHSPKAGKKVKIILNSDQHIKSLKCNYVSMNVFLPPSRTVPVWNAFWLHKKTHLHTKFIMWLHTSSQLYTVSSFSWLCWLSGPKLNHFGSVSVLSLTLFQAAGSCFEQKKKKKKSHIISVHTNPINRLYPSGPAVCFCLWKLETYVKMNISLCCSFKLYSYTKLCRRSRRVWE